MKKKLALLIALTVMLGLASPAAAPFAQAASTTTKTASATSNNTNKTAQPNTATGSTATGEEDDLDPALLAEMQVFVDYAAQIKPLNTYSDKASAALQTLPDITAKNRKQVYAILTNTVVPNCTKLVAGLKKIKPNNAELAQIHAQFVKANVLQLEGVTLLQKYAASTKLNVSLLSQAGTKFKSAATFASAYEQAINKYAAKFN
ncbi:hypothetical protein [Paenibacillus campi]|uniref:hypothetical protein n=1 Tax=Paenibacillus campi TaxID=3106031 RepID=UPI002AFFE412|nr:hypothetical protein [Paenibacillus sp. SGZ-1009]